MHRKTKMRVMKNFIFITLIVYSLSLFAKPLHLPEERTYKPKVDRGFTQYNTPSLYYTNKYVLTFDDGPSLEHTPRILNELKKHNVKATFFVLTKRINNKSFKLFKRILDEGHIIGSHLHNHHNSNKLTEKAFENELRRSINILMKYYKKAGHKFDKAYFRFPYAEYGKRKDYHHINIIKRVSKRLFKENCIHFVFWDIDSADWVKTLTQKELMQNITVAQTGGKYTSFSFKEVNGKKIIVKKPSYKKVPTQGGVILFHDVQEKTKRSMGKILRYFKENQLEIVPLDDVEEFSYSNTGCFK